MPDELEVPDELILVRFFFYGAIGAPPDDPDESGSGDWAGSLWS